MRSATAEERAAVLAFLRVGPVPPELDQAATRYVRQVGRRAATVDEVHILEFGRTQDIALGVVPGATRLALVRHP